MDIFIAWDSDDLSREVTLASQSDNATKLRQISQATERGNLVWKSWVESCGGNIITVDGAHGRASIPASRLGELQATREQYESAVDSKASVGVGMKLSDADKSLKAAKAQGGNRIVMYTVEVEEILGQSEEKPKSPLDALAQEYLTKADGGAVTPPIADPAKLAGAHAGMSGASRPSMPTVDAPTVEASEHSQGESMHALMDEENPNPPEMTHAQQDLEELFHSLASEGHSQDARDEADKAHKNAKAQQPDALDEIRQKVGEVLKSVKGQTQVIEQMKQGNPELYESFMGLIGVMIEMAHQLTVTGPQNPGEEAPTPDELAPAEESEGKEEPSEDTKKSELQKNRSTPKFPKMGLGDDRRETPIVSTFRELQTKASAIANTYDKAGLYQPNSTKSPLHRFARPEVPSEEVWDDFDANTGGLKARVRNNTKTALKTGANGAANAFGSNQVSYSLGSNLRPINSSPGSSPQAPMATKLHEDWHMMMGRIQKKYGQQGRENVVENMLTELGKRDPGAAQALEGYSRAKMGNSYDPSQPTFREEKIASLMNYLNNPREREMFHRGFNHSDEDAQLFGNAIKRAHTHLTQMGNSDVTKLWALQPKHLKQQQKLTPKLPGMGKKMRKDETPLAPPTQPTAPVKVHHTETPEFKNWFGDSKVVHHETGKPLRVLHGTTHDFTEFSTKKGNPGNYFGRGHYFSDAPDDVGHNYATDNGPDLRNKIDHETEQLANKRNVDWNDPQYDKLKEKVRGKVVGPAPRTIPAYLKMRNPVHVTPHGGTMYHYEEELDDNGDPTGKVNGNGEKLLNAIHKTVAKYQKYNPRLDANEITGHVMEHAPLYDGAYAHDVDSALRSHEDLMELGDEKGTPLHHEFIRDVFRAAGHDGIIHNADRFGMKGTQGAKHYIVFSPTQIKSATGNTGAYDPKSKDFGKDELAFSKNVDGVPSIAPVSLPKQDTSKPGLKPPAIAPMVAPKPAAPAPTAPAAFSAPPKLHDNVEGFLTAFKGLPKGDASRGKFITQHMNHGPFLSSLKAHPQGQQVHKMLTQHLNSASNAGFKAGTAQATIKAEPTGVPHSTRHHVILPVGTYKEGVGKIKVQHGEGGTGWVQARAGQIMSADGHPISSRNPGGK